MPPFFAALVPYRALFASIALLALVASLVYAFNSFVDHHQKIGYGRAVAEQAAQNLKDTESARKKEEESRKQLEIAQNANTIQNQRIDALAASLNRATGGLRDTANGILRDLPSASAEAARATATAFAGVFQDCTGRYTEVAKNADRHVADVKLFRDGWPTVEPSPAE